MIFSTDFLVGMFTGVLAVALYVEILMKAFEGSKDD